MTSRQHAKCDSQLCTPCGVIAFWTSPVPALNDAACVSQRKTGHWCSSLWPRGRCQATWADGFMCSIYLTERSAFVCFNLTKRSAVAIWSCTDTALKRITNDSNSGMLLRIYSKTCVQGKHGRTFGFTVLLLKPYFHLSQTAVWTWHGTSYASTSVCLQRQRHVPQFITNGRLCTPFMHERVCMP